MSVPTIVKVLRYLKDTRATKTQKELAIIISEPEEYVNKALERLTALNIIAQEAGHYLYVPNPKNDEFSTQLMEVYEKVSQKPAKELLMRGLICQVPSQYLLHIPALFEILEREGFDKQELDQFLEQESANGYLKRRRVVYIGLESSIIPICMPPFYFHYLGQMGIIDHQEYSSLGQEHKDRELREEDYLIAQYPPELANPAKEYIERERKELKNNLRRRGLVSWGGGLWRFA